MKVYHGKYVLPGTIVFLVIVTFPIWYGMANSKPPFENRVPKAEDEECIESKEYMRANHMQMLVDWRDEVVREGERVYTATDGQQWVKSLTNTCMACHGKADANGESTSAATYCMHCHQYVGVHTPTYCWDCHIDPVDVGKGE